MQEHSKRVLAGYQKGMPIYLELEKRFNEVSEGEDLENKKKRL